MILALNTATQYTEFALLKGRRILFEQSWLSHKDEAAKLLPALKKSMKKHHIDFSDLKGVFVVNGPGSFSGLRIGVTIANALAYSHQLPLFCCDTFELLAEKIPPKYRKDSVSGLYSGSGRVAVRSGKKILQCDFEECVQKFFVKGLVKRKEVYVCIDMPSAQKSALQKVIRSAKLSKKVIFLKPADLRTFGEVARKFLRSRLRQQRLVAPLYLQKPHITQSKKPVFL